VLLSGHVRIYLKPISKADYTFKSLYERFYVLGRLLVWSHDDVASDNVEWDGRFVSPAPVGLVMCACLHFAFVVNGRGISLCQDV